VGEPTGSDGPATVNRTDANGDGEVGVGDTINVEMGWTYNWIAPLELIGLSGTTSRTVDATMRLETEDDDKPCP
jgi:hypothetical protein